VTGQENENQKKRKARVFNMTFKSSDPGEPNSPRQSMLISDTAKETSMAATAAVYTLLLDSLVFVKENSKDFLESGKKEVFFGYLDSAKQMSEIAKNMFDLGSSSRKEALDMMEYVNKHADLLSPLNTPKKDVKAS
jgi:hypothetical protein